MIFLYAIIYTMLLSLAYSLNTCTPEGTVSSKSECHNLPLEPQYSHCCFGHVKVTGLELKTCFPVTKEQYDKIDEYMKSYEKTAESQNAKIISFDCISYYLHTTILALLLLFILI